VPQLPQLRAEVADGACDLQLRPVGGLAIRHLILRVKGALTSAFKVLVFQSYLREDVVRPIAVEHLHVVADVHLGQVVLHSTLNAGQLSRRFRFLAPGHISEAAAVVAVAVVVVAVVVVAEAVAGEEDVGQNALVPRAENANGQSDHFHCKEMHQ